MKKYSMVEAMQEEISPEPHVEGFRRVDLQEQEDGIKAEGSQESLVGTLENRTMKIKRECDVSIVKVHTT